MSFMDEQLLKFKNMIEQAIVTGGSRGKESVIRSSALINLIHDVVKKELINEGVHADNIFPPFGKSKPEIKMAGFLKQKNQDVCVLPANIDRKPMIIDWGPLRFEKKRDPYGLEFTENSLIINVRSQMSSLAKNSDTLFERTFAEAQNLHMRCKNAVLGEVYLIPAYEYDDILVSQNRVGFKSSPTNIEKYISFFDSINHRSVCGADYEYERCALLIVDFNRPQPKLYQDSDQLRKDGLISSSFEIDYQTLAFDSFAGDILKIYASRHNINNLRVSFLQ